MNCHHSEGGALLLALGSEDGAARHNAPCPRSHSRTQRRAHRGSEAHSRQIRRRKKLKSTTKNTTKTNKQNQKNTLVRMLRMCHCCWHLEARTGQAGAVPSGVRRTWTPHTEAPCTAPRCGKSQLLGSPSPIYSEHHHCLSQGGWAKALCPPFGSWPACPLVRRPQHEATGEAQAHGPALTSHPRLHAARHRHPWLLGAKAKPQEQVRQGPVLPLLGKHLPPPHKTLPGPGFLPSLFIKGKIYKPVTSKSTPIPSLRLFN